MQEPRMKELTTCTLLECLHTENFESIEVLENEIEPICISYVTMDTCYFKGISFQNITLKGVDFVDVIFDNCDISNVVFVERSIHRVKFKNCRLTGVSFIQCFLGNIQIIDCQANYINFASGKIRDMEIRNSSLVQSSFIELTTKNLSIQECDLTRSEMFKCEFPKLDLSTSTINELQVDIPSLKGVTVSMYQAAELATLLGLKVKY